MSGADMSGPIERRPRSLRLDLLSFVGLRLASGLLSFLLFALLARWFTSHETKALYYLLFLMGFFTSALRTLATVAAALRAGESRSAKLRRVASAYGQVVAAAMMLLPLAIWATSTLAMPVWVYAGVVVLLLAWGVDIDILRAVFGRSSVVPAAAAIGAVLAIVCAALFRSVEGAAAAIFLQWLPICLLNAWVLVRWHRRIARGALEALNRIGGKVWGPLAVAIFDGTVLNTPFFLGDLTPPELGRSIGIVTRIFVAALIILPLLVFWSNGDAIGRFARALRLPVPVIYGGMTLITGLAAGAAFAAVFALTAGVSPAPHELAASALLLLGYSCYAPAARYRGQLSTALVGVLLLLAAANAAAIVAVIALQGQALAVACFQASCLLLAAVLMCRPSR
jgi:hypothetical protein